VAAAAALVAAVSRYHAGRGAAALLLGLLLALALPAGAQEPGELELKVKAAFLFNFVKFITWPPPRMPARDEAYALCTIDAPEFAAMLAEVVRGKAVEGHALDVRSLRRGEGVSACHVVYFAAADPELVEATLRPASGPGILTVHEARAAVPSGAVRFYVAERRVRFEVNTAAAEQQQLQLSSRLLGVATRLQLRGGS